MSPKNASFRLDINGLRAWAVGSVVLYHFGIPGFSGGFLGVDVFFVISGFLMTGIVVKGLTNLKDANWKKQIRWIIDFYLARAARIVPALVVLIAVLCVFGWFFFPAPDFKNFARHAVASIFFLSNIRFWSEAGYFDTASHEKILLHTWSLSAEWQFYIAYPIVLLVIYRVFRTQRMLLAAMLFGFAASLALSAYLTEKSPVAAFFLLPTRAWEMLAGGLVYFYKDAGILTPRIRNIAEKIGFTLILSGLFWFSTDDAWPGWRALVPVCGAALVMLANRSDSIFTASRPAQWLGDTSYSIYLWHWPIAVILLYGGWSRNWAYIAIAIVITLLLGVASYYLVETPARQLLSKNRSYINFGGLIATSLLVSAGSYLIYHTGGFPNNRLPNQVEAIASEVTNRNPRVAECFGQAGKYTAACKYGGAEPGAIVLGDSHAASVVRAVERSLDNAKYHVVDFTMSACPTVLGIQSKKSRRCPVFLQEAVDRITLYSSSVPLIIINRTSYYFSGPNSVPTEQSQFAPDIYFIKPIKSVTADFMNKFSDQFVSTVCKFTAQRPVYLVRPFPEMPNHVANSMARGLMFNHRFKQLSIPLESYHERNAVTLKLQDRAVTECGAKILDPIPYLCHDGRCWGDHDGLPVYFDEDHLNERGGNLLIPMFQKIAEPAFSTSPTVR